MITTLSNVEIKRNYIFLKSIYKIPTADVLINGSRQKASPTTGKNGKDVRLHHSQHSTRSSSQCNRARKKKRKCTLIRKEEIKSSLFADYMTVWIGLPRNLQKTWELMSSARMQDTRPTGKNEFHFYVLKMNTWKWKLDIQSYWQLLQSKWDLAKNRYNICVLKVTKRKDVNTRRDLSVYGMEDTPVKMHLPLQVGL